MRDERIRFEYGVKRFGWLRVLLGELRERFEMRRHPTFMPGYHCIASLARGVFQSLISKWGLIQHYWVAFKLLMNVLSTAVLVGHMRPIALVADAALGHEFGRGELNNVRVQIAVDACAAVLVLVIATALAIYKPRGVTSYGWRKQQARQANAAA